MPNNQTIITVDLTNSAITSVSGFAPTNNPTFTGTINATGATSVAFPYNTNIGLVTNQEISYLSGLTSNIQSQINNIQITSVSGDLTLYKTGGVASLIFEGANPDNYETSLVPIEPVVDYTFYLPAPSETGSSNLVSDTLTQTLTNKTLTSPIINNGTINTPTINTPTISTPTITGTINNLNLPTSTSGTKIYSVYFKKATADLINGNSSVYLAPTGFPGSSGVSNFPITAGKTYHFKVMGLWGSANATNGLQQQLNILDTNGSAQTSSGIVYVLINTAESTTYNANWHNSTQSVSWTTSDTTPINLTNSPATFITTNSPLSFFIEGHFTPTSNGTFWYGFKPSASYNVTMYQNTFITISEV